MSFENPGDDIRCDHCDRPGVPYEYRGLTFSGLSANRGERLCSRCLNHSVDQEIADRPDPGVFVCSKKSALYASLTAGKRKR